MSKNVNKDGGPSVVSVELDGNDSDSYGGNGDVIKSIDESDSTVLDLNTQGVDSDVPVFSPEKSPKKRKKRDKTSDPDETHKTTPLKDRAKIKSKTKLASTIEKPVVKKGKIAKRNSKDGVKIKGRLKGIAKTKSVKVLEKCSGDDVEEIITIVKPSASTAVAARKEVQKLIKQDGGSKMADNTSAAKGEGSAATTSVTPDKPEQVAGLTQSSSESARTKAKKMGRPKKLNPDILSM